MTTARAALALSIVAVVLAGVAYLQGRHAAPPAETKMAQDQAAPDDQSHDHGAGGYVPGLGEIMTAVQMRHAKLGVAGAAGNWPLASYELDELDEGLDDAVTFHPTHKDMKQSLMDLVPTFMKGPIADLRAAVEAKDTGTFNAAFDALTTGCNGCHQASNFGFNVVIRPTAPPVPNQEFAPAK
jgi:hypothetical protein